MERVDILDRILRLEGVSYELDKTKDNLQGRQQRADVHGRQYGLIAQEVEKIFPELVCTDDYDFKGLHYARFAITLSSPPPRGSCFSEFSFFFSQSTRH
jgi:hypothetical protein